MFKHLTNVNTYKYLDVLQALVDGYNATYHNSIKMQQRHVTDVHQSIIRLRLYGIAEKNDRCQAYKYDIGTKVRISTQRQTFSKVYLPSWSEEVS